MSHACPCQANTCGDDDGANGSAAPYSCTGVYRRKTGVDSFVIQALTDAEKIDACCELVSAAGSAVAGAVYFNTALQWASQKGTFCT